MCAVFLQDRRQALRLKQPLAANVAKTSTNSDNKDFLPVLHDSSTKTSSTTNTNKSSSNGRAIPGWKPPPQKNEHKVENKVPGQYQLDIANRLSKGLSSSRQQNDEDKLLNRGGGAGPHKMVVSAKHRIYRNTCTSSGSAAGSIYTASALAANVNTNSQTDIVPRNQYMINLQQNSSSSNNVLDPFRVVLDQNINYNGIEIALNQRTNSGRYILLINI
jgi:hypothetical protein